MPQIESVYTATATEAEMDDEPAAGGTGGLNPDLDEQLGQIQITLFFDGVTVDKSDIYDMLNTQFGTVTQNKVAARGTYEFRISA